MCYYRDNEAKVCIQPLPLTTAYLEHLQLRAAESDDSISQLVENAVKYQILEDFEDIEDAEKREHESTHSFNDLVKQFKAEGLL